jgi:Mg2+ and Co2+ transporter CorA
MEERILNKLDEMDKTLDAINRTLAAQHVEIQNHIRRTDIAESRQNNFEKIMVDVVLAHINQVNGAFKLLGIISTIVAVVGGIASLSGLI